MDFTHQVSSHQNFYGIEYVTRLSGALNQGDEFPALIPSRAKTVNTGSQIPVKRSGSLELCSLVVKLCCSLENEMFCPRCHES